jgi:hypothetical protein
VLRPVPPCQRPWAQRQRLVGVGLEPAGVAHGSNARRVAAGQVSNFQTDEPSPGKPSFHCRHRESINAWIRPNEFAGDCVVHNGDEASHCTCDSRTVPPSTRRRPCRGWLAVLAAQRDGHRQQLGRGDTGTRPPAACGGVCRVLLSVGSTDSEVNGAFHRMELHSALDIA